MENKKGNSPVNQWTGLQGTLSLYKTAAITSSGLCFLLALIIMSMLGREPLVVVEECNQKKFYKAMSKPLKVEENDVEGFVKDFVKLRYEWDEFNPKSIVGGLSCITTKGVRQKLNKILGTKGFKNQKEDPSSKGRKKTISQYVDESKIRVSLEKGHSIASFDRVTRINGIPIAIEKELELEIVQDVKTACNPLGLYINGINEVEKN